MKHLSEEQLAQQYWGEPDRTAERHLAMCSVCSAAYTALSTHLASVQSDDIPERDENYGEQMWARVSAALPPRAFVKANRLILWRGFAYAAGCVVLVAGSFWMGRIWEHKQQSQAPVAKQAAVSTEPHMVVIVLSDHLERSERLLVELKHADAEDQALVKPLQDEARRLLATNRVCIEKASQEDDDPRLMKALSELGKVLNAIGTQKGDMTGTDLERIRNQVNAEDLLFQVRVLRSKAPGYAWTVEAASTGGAA